jgi:hypothetical protein
MTQWRDCSQFILADMPPTAAESVRTYQWSELLAAKEAACGISYPAFWARSHRSDTEVARWEATVVVKEAEER